MAGRINITRRNFLAGLGFVSATALAACAQGGSEGGAAAPAADTPKTEPFDKLLEADGNFAYNALDDGVEYHFSNVLSPAYYVFGGALDADGAAELVGQLGLAQSIETYVGSVVVVNPIDGKAYTAADADKFVELAAAAGPANNVKVIGVYSLMVAPRLTPRACPLCRHTSAMPRRQPTMLSSLPMVPPRRIRASMRMPTIR